MNAFYEKLGRLAAILEDGEIIKADAENNRAFVFYPDDRDIVAYRITPRCEVMFQAKVSDLKALLLKVEEG